MKSEKGNQRRRQKQGMVSVWGHKGIPVTLLREEEALLHNAEMLSRVNSTTFVLEKRRSIMKKGLGLLALVLLLGGCGSSGSNDGDTGSKEKLVVGMECNYAPFNWTDTDSNEYNYPVEAGGYCDGYDVQIAKNIADALDRELVISKMDWDSLEPSLNSGSIDAIIAGMTDTKKRRENADFTTPYYQSKMALIVLKDGKYANATSLDDFSGATVQGQLNTMYDTVIDQIPNVNHAQPLENYPYMIAALKSGTVDALTAETPVALGAVAAHPELAMVEFDDDKGFQIDLSDTAVSIAVKKGNSELLNNIQKALDEIEESSRVQMMEDATKRQPAGE